MRRWYKVVWAIAALEVSAALGACGALTPSDQAPSAQNAAAATSERPPIPKEGEPLALDATATFDQVSFGYPASWGVPYLSKEHLLITAKTSDEGPSIIAMVSSDFDHKPPVAPLDQADSYYTALADGVNQTTGKEPYLTVTTADPWMVERGDGYVKLMASYVSRTGGNGKEWYGIKALVFTASNVYLFDVQCLPAYLSNYLRTMEAMAKSVTATSSTSSIPTSAS